MVAAWITTVWARSDRASTIGAPRAHQAQLARPSFTSICRKVTTRVHCKKSFFLNVKKTIPFYPVSMEVCNNFQKLGTPFLGHYAMVDVCPCPQRKQTVPRKGYLAHTCKPSGPNPNSKHCRHKQPAPGKSQPERILQPVVLAVQKSCWPKIFKGCKAVLLP